VEPVIFYGLYAGVAELVDALASGVSGGNPVEVQVLSSVPDSDSGCGLDPSLASGVFLKFTFLLQQ
jgi:hypothetical protein